MYWLRIYCITELYGTSYNIGNTYIRICNSKTNLEIIYRNINCNVFILNMIRLNLKYYIFDINNEYLYLQAISGITQYNLFSLKYQSRG